MKISIKLFYYKIVAPNLYLFSIVLFTALYCIFLDYCIAYYIHLKYKYAYNKHIHIHTWSSTISEKQACVNILSWLRRLSSSSLHLSTGSVPANSHISGFYKLLVAFIVRFLEAWRFVNKREWICYLENREHPTPDKPGKLWSRIWWFATCAILLSYILFSTDFSSNSSLGLIDEN